MRRICISRQGAYKKRQDFIFRLKRRWAFPKSALYVDFCRFNGNLLYDFKNTRHRYRYNLELRNEKKSVERGMILRFS